jgi:hypothetical protein
MSSVFGMLPISDTMLSDLIKLPVSDNMFSEQNYLFNNIMYNNFTSSSKMLSDNIMLSDSMSFFFILLDNFTRKRVLQNIPSVELS